MSVSAGGALVADGDPVHPGGLVDVELDLDGDTIRCRAEAVRRGMKTGGVTSRTSAALRFIGLPAAQRDRIAVYVLSAQARQKAARHHAPGVRAPRPEDDSPEQARRSPPSDGGAERSPRRSPGSPRAG